jgi:hypothetical protein
VQRDLTTLSFFTFQNPAFAKLPVYYYANGYLCAGPAQKDSFGKHTFLNRG